MGRPGDVTDLDVTQALAHGSLRGVRPLYISPVRAVIDGVVIVNQLDAIRRVPPNTVVVLSDDMGSGGWQISAALRHAWERKASALIVPRSTYAGSTVVLAERLDINLLSAEQDASIVALALAAEIGIVQSARDVDLATFAKAVTKESTVGNVLKTISHRLGNLRVTLEHDGTILMASGTGPQQDSPIMVELPLVENWGRARLLAHIPKKGGHDSEVVRTYLEIASPSVLAAWLAGEVSDAAASDSTLALADLAEESPAGLGAANADYSNLVARLGWRSDLPYEAVWISHAPDQPHRSGRTAIVRLLWRKVAPRRPLAEVDGGWLALVPVSDIEGPAILERRVMDKLGPSLAELGFSVGISQRLGGTENLLKIVQQARISARYAYHSAAGSTVSFGTLGVRAASAFVDTEDIVTIAKLALPELMTAPDRGQIVRDVLAFLDHQSSVTLAATSLDLHRNTMQQRLNRAREIGLRFDDPGQLFCLHLILTVLDRTP